MEKAFGYLKPKPDFEQKRIVVMLISLGTPNALTKKSIRHFLRRFLSDHRVVSIPKPLWLPILHGPILLLRPKKLIRAYASIWTDKGSPLYFHTFELAEKLKNLLGFNTQVLPAMTYSEPLLSKVTQKAVLEGCSHLIALPLYPQYSSTTSAPCFDIISKKMRQCLVQPPFTMIPSYHDNACYLDAIAKQIAKHRAAHGQNRNLLFSFHGLPKRIDKAMDPYKKQCYESAQGIIQRLDIPSEKWHLSFQSRFGAEKWLEPSTSALICDLARTDGKSGLDICCPGFSVDCLETLEEIRLGGMEIWREAGGKDFAYIECLNSGPDHLKVIADILKPYIDAINLQSATRPKALEPSLH